MPKKMHEMSLEELKDKQKTLKKAIPLLAGMIAVMLAVCIYLTVKQGFSVFTVMPIIFLASLAANCASLKAIEKEIAAREAQS